MITLMNGDTIETCTKCWAKRRGRMTWRWCRFDTPPVRLAANEVVEVPND